MMSTWSREGKLETNFSSPAFKHLVDSCLHLVCQGDDWGRATWLREWKYSSQPHIMARPKVGKVFTERLRRWARPLSMMSRDHLCALWVDPPFLSFFLFSPLLLLTAILLVIGWWRSKQCSQCQFCIFPGPSLSFFLFAWLQLLCSLQYNWWKDGEGPNNAVKRQFCICYKDKHIETLPSSFIGMHCTFQSVALGAKKSTDVWQGTFLY